MTTACGAPDRRRKLRLETHGGGVAAANRRRCHERQAHGASSKCLGRVVGSVHDVNQLLGRLCTANSQCATRPRRASLRTIPSERCDAQARRRPPCFRRGLGRAARQGFEALALSTWDQQTHDLKEPAVPCFFMRKPCTRLQK